MLWPATCLQAPVPHPARQLSRGRQSSADLLPRPVPSSPQAIDAFHPTHRLLERPLRLPVTDVVRSGKAGVTVGGKLEGGALRPGSRVLIMPSGEAATVK